MNKIGGIGIGILGILLLAAFFSSGCISVELEPTYTVSVDCPLSSYTYTGLTYEEVEQVRDSKPFYCSIRVVEE